MRPQDLLVTLYRQLGIDPETSFTNRAGRPISIGSDGEVIRELLGLVTAEGRRPTMKRS